jgi:hypothetical protein
MTGVTGNTACVVTAMNTPEDRKADDTETDGSYKIERPTDSRSWCVGLQAKWRQHWRTLVFRNVVLVILVVITAATITQFVPRTSISIPRLRTPGSMDNNVVIESVDVLAEFISQLLNNNNLPKKAQDALVNNLRLIQADITYTESEIKKNPNNTNLRALLLNLYQQQADLMNQAQQAQVQTLPEAGA